MFNFQCISNWWYYLDRLRDVHLQLGLDEGTSTGGRKFLVSGSYLYYHYQQVYSEFLFIFLLKFFRIWMTMGGDVHIALYKQFVRG